MYSLLFLFACLVSRAQGHDYNRIRKLETRLMYEIDDLRTSLQEEIGHVLNERISSYLQNELLPAILPQHMQEAFQDFVKTGKLQEMSASIASEQASNMARDLRQLKSKIQSLIQKLEEENTESGERLEKIEKQISQEVRMGTCTGGDIFQRLLAVGYYGRQFHQFSLTTGQRRVFPLSSHHTLDVQYDSSTFRIIWSNQSTGEVGAMYSKSIADDDSPIRLLKEDPGFKPYGLALDIPRNKLFFANNGRYAAIGEIALDGGQKPKRILSMTDHDKLFFITIHKKKQLIFWSEMKVIGRMSYSGAKKQIIYQGRHVTGIAVDEVNDLLYFGDELVIYSYYIESGKRHFVSKISAHEAIHKLLYHNEMLYIATPEHILRLNTRTKKVITLGYLHGDITGLCFLP